MASKRILIVGGVAGGASCAARLRRLDEQAEIFIFERGQSVSVASCGMPYYLGGVIPDRKQLLVASPERFRDWFRVEVRTRHEVSAIDRGARTIEVRNVQTGLVSRERYDVLVLAPGAAPVRPPLPGIDLPGVFCLRSLEDADGIQGWLSHHKAEQAVVVGGGYIGLEMVENLLRRGMEVTVLEMLSQVMPPMDPEMVAPIHQELRRQGVDLRLSTGLASIEPGAQDTLIAVDKAAERIGAGIVIVAAGVKPDVALARRAGLEIGELGGIRVDEQMRTSDPAIWAVGDAVEVRDFVTGAWALIPLAGPANRQGRVAAEAIAGRPRRFRGVQGTAVCGLFGLTVASTGASEKTLRRVGGFLFDRAYLHPAHHVGYYPGARPMTLKLLFATGDGRVLGAQAVGTEGVEKRIDAIAMAIQKSATVYDLEEAELCYAPQFGAAKDPVNLAGMIAANVLRGDVSLAAWEDLAGTTALVLDVRDPGELSAGRVPGAISIPLPELRSRLEELPRDREIWVYCAAGQRSYYATRILRQRGFRARNLPGGFKTYRQLAAKVGG
jgi:NADPH-dependent 2,4-dienoyl-CoA reductase/sulfur reductase-like enzyme/rhodanese-related sulfurtransferase